MDRNLILTIGRQCGSGGHEIGTRLAQRLAIDYYDKELLAEAAKHSGLEEALFQKFDEKPTNSFLYSLVMGTRPTKGLRQRDYALPLPERVLLAEFDTMKKLASERSAVFIGRCADYALRDLPNRVSLFLYAPLETRIQRIQARRGLDAAEAEALIYQVDKRRAAYYDHYTTQRWGDVRNYHLCIDTSLCGIDGTVAYILELLKHRT